MSPKRIIYSIGLALMLASCADELVTDRSNSDGSISFMVDPQGHSFSSRGGSAAPALSHHKSLSLQPVGNQDLWLHVESAENPASFKSEYTRALPVSLDDLEDFTVTTTIAETGNTFFTEKLLKDNNWSTSTKYYWPQTGDLIFHCVPGNLPEEIQLSSGETSFGFDYTMPESNGETDADNQPDFVLATHKYNRSSAPRGVANIRFQHPLAGICFVQDESLPDENLRIVKIELNGLYGEGHCEFDGSNPLYTNVMTSNWSGKKSANSSYVQTADSENPVSVPLINSKTITAVAKPFMVIPHTHEELSSFKCKVTLKSGDVREADLSGIDGLEPGRMYIITLSGLDDKYPPVNNPSGMAGNGTISLKWDNPDPTYEHDRQCGVTIKIVQKGKDANGNPIQSAQLTKSFHWADSHEGELFPADKASLDLFAYVTEGTDDQGNTITVNTRLYNEFECHIYADYYNTEEQSYKEGNPVIHQSTLKRVIIKPGISDDTVLFYIPEGAKTPEGLLDDDDVAAWAWFKRTYPNGDYVTYDKLAEKAAEGFNVVWVPCGVQLRGGNDYEYITSVGDADTRISEVNSILNSEKMPDYLTKMGRDYYNEFLGGPADKLKQGARVPGAYNDHATGIIKKVNPTEYFTQKDIDAIRDFYARGGNLLLTTFSIELAVDFGVIPYNSWRFNGADDLRNECRPFFHLFNEVKPSSIWFVRSEFGSHQMGSHPLYQGMFKSAANIFPETVSDIHEFENDDNSGYIYVGSDQDRSIPMYPLLSMGADACENNNVVWDFTPDQGHQLGKTMANMEEQCNGRFLGTWGQRGDDNVGVIFEFYPGKTHDLIYWNDDHYNHLEEGEKNISGKNLDGEVVSGIDWIKFAFRNHGR
ncbi:MAG: hypothetical protein K2K58_05580 [Muribaculaceae bacterium]|nr:hypothetical protein [Muribaculaceae bacterium]